ESVAQLRVRRPVKERPPVWLLVPAAVGLAFLVLPVVAVVRRAPWGELGHELASGPVRTALRLSLVTSVAATALAMLLGVPLAWVLARSEWRLLRLVRAVTLLPLVLPPVVGGVALLLAFGSRGLIGQWLDRTFGLTLPFTTAGAVVAELFVALPFAVVTVEAGLRAVDRRPEEA